MVDDLVDDQYHVVQARCFGHYQLTKPMLVTWCQEHHQRHAVVSSMRPRHALSAFTLGTTHAFDSDPSWLPFLLVTVYYPTNWRSQLDAQIKFPFPSSQLQPFRLTLKLWPSIHNHNNRTQLSLCYSGNTSQNNSLRCRLLAILAHLIPLYTHLTSTRSYLGTNDLLREDPVNLIIAHQCWVF